METSHSGSYIYFFHLLLDCTYHRKMARLKDFSEEGNRIFNFFFRYIIETAQILQKFWKLQAIAEVEGCGQWKSDILAYFWKPGLGFLSLQLYWGA